MNLRKKQRRLIEDALKHIYHCESQQLPCTIQSLAGALSLDTDQVTKLLSSLEKLALIESGRRGIELSECGKKYALAVIRTHRLLELYMATETGINEKEWHSQAEVKEHELSGDDVDQIAKIMGNPRYDPHGTPIPTKSGELPPKRAVSLVDLHEGDCARIAYIEDEPKSVYAKIAAIGLCQGTELKILQHGPDRIRFLADGEEVELSPLYAANVNVTPLEKERDIERPRQSLTDLGLGQQGIVRGISRKIRGRQRRRLMDMGVIPGTVITAQMKSPGGDPTAYVIRGASIALRREQASRIYIDRIDGERK